jgi:hypothetical protein
VQISKHFPDKQIYWKPLKRETERETERERLCACVCVFENLFGSYRGVKVSPLTLSHRKPVHRSRDSGSRNVFIHPEIRHLFACRIFCFHAPLCFCLFHHTQFPFASLRFEKSVKHLKEKKNTHTEDQQFHIPDFVAYERDRRPYFLRNVMFLSVNIT